MHPQWRSSRFALALILAVCVSWLAVACGTESGSKEIGEERLEFVARIDQNGADFVIYGYVTAASEIPSEQLFASGTSPVERDAGAARVTFHGTTRITTRSVVENIFDVASRGNITFYYNEQGADFADPASFQRGDEVAVSTVSFQNVITVTAPNTGLSNGTGTMTFTDVESFSGGDEEYELVPDNERQRITAVGSGTRIEPNIPQATIHIAGNTVAIGDGED